MNWMTFLQNPKGQVMRKFLAEILQQRNTQAYMDLIDRVAASLVTEADLVLFNKMIVDIYEIGYLKAVDDHKEKLAELGFKVAVIPQKKG